MKRATRKGLFLKANVARLLMEDEEIDTSFDDPVLWVRAKMVGLGLGIPNPQSFRVWPCYHLHLQIFRKQDAKKVKLIFISQDAKIARNTRKQESV